MWHAWTTHVVCLESGRVSGKYPYIFTERFSMLESLLPLPAFEQKFAADVVRAVYTFKVEGTVSHLGTTCLRPVRAKEVSTLVTKGSHRRPHSNIEGEEESDDSCEHLGDECDDDTRGTRKSLTLT